MISVIVPVYNAEEYLRKCIESLICQTMKNIQIILVDDGSTDTSSKICDEYALKDDRILVIHQDNGGLSAARNTGLKYAQGDYITFLDSDDFFDLDCCEKIFQKSQQEQVDIVMFGHRNIQYGTDKYENRTYKNRVVRGKENVMKLLFDPEFNVISCAKLYKKEIFNELRYPVGLIHEDVYIIVDILRQCESFCFYEEIFYNRIVHEGSITSTISKNRLCEITAYEHWLTVFRDNKVFYQKSLKKLLDAIIYTYCLVYPILNKSEKKEITNKFKRYYKNYNLKESYKVKIKYLYFSYFPKIFVYMRKKVKK